MIFSIDDADENVIEVLKKIDWHAVSESQLASLNSSLELHREASMLKKIADFSFVNSVYVSVGVSAALIGAYAFGANALTLLVGTITMLLCITVLDYVKRQSNSSLALAQRQALMLELKSLQTPDEDVDVTIEEALAEL